ncbi:MAG: MFS transporter [Acidimicrobiia bacterium]|nr:MFS transporter [Acidimicrobiia bacterium]
MSITAPVADIEVTRRRLIWTLFAGNAIGSTAYIGIATVAALIADEITGSTSLSGLPSATGTLGVALGAGILSWTSYRTGRRMSFTAGYAVAVLGAGLVIVSIGSSSFFLLLAGMVGIGIGRSVGQLARYAAGDMRSESRRASAISLIVWASTIGAIVGPPLIGPTGSLALAAGLDELVGPVVVAVLGYALVSILMLIGLRPDPMTLAVSDVDEGNEGVARPISGLLRSRTVQLSITAIILSQVVMVLVMVMTPIHMRAFGDSLTTIGYVMMAHTLGMFAIAPITGWFINRVGAKRMILVAVAVFLVACLLAATATTAGTSTLLVSMFLLGVAWNFGFVSGSTLLQSGQTVANRLKLQGVADTSAWISSAAASAGSGILLSATSFRTLALAGAALALIPLIPLFRLTVASAP